MAKSTSLSPTNEATVEPRRRVAKVPSRYAAAAATTASSPIAPPPRQAVGRDDDVRGAGAHRKHADEPEHGQRHRTDAHPERREDDGRQTAVAVAGADEEHRQPDGREQPPHDTAAIWTGLAGDGEDERQAEEGH